MNKDQLYSNFRAILISDENLNNYQVNRLCGILHNILYPTPEETPPTPDKEAFERIDNKIKEKLNNEANSKQIGGQHYKSKNIQPWDYIISNELGFLEGNAIKYITRHKDKNGLQDIEKAIHYLEKLKESYETSNQI